jgi:hypothetical protein
MLALAALQQYGFFPSAAVAPAPPRAPSVLRVGESQQFTTITQALQAASAGDVINVAPGTYLGPITLKDGVAVMGAGPGSTIIRLVISAEAIVAAEDITARLAGVQIQGDGVVPVGLALSGSSLEVDNLVVTGNTWRGHPSQRRTRLDDFRPGFFVYRKQHFQIEPLAKAGSAASDSGRSFGLILRQFVRYAAKRHRRWTRCRRTKGVLTSKPLLHQMDCGFCRECARQGRRYR